MKASLQFIPDGPVRIQIVMSIELSTKVINSFDMSILMFDIHILIIEIDIVIIGIRSVREWVWTASNHSNVKNLHLPIYIRQEAWYLTCRESRYLSTTRLTEIYIDYWHKHLWLLTYLPCFLTFDALFKLSLMSRTKIFTCRNQESSKHIFVCNYAGEYIFPGTATTM